MPQNSNIQPDPELLANAPNYPAPPPPGNRGVLSEQEIDAAITAGLEKKQEHVAKIDQAGDVLEYRDMAVGIHLDLAAAGKKVTMADRQAVEARLIERREIEPLKERIEQAEAQLKQLEETPGIEPGDERIEAQKAELNDLYESLDNWEVRVEALKKGMAQDDRKQRLAAINAEHAVEKNDLEGIEKVNQVQFQPEDEGPAMERRQARLVAASGLAAGAKMNRPTLKDITRDEMEGQIKASFKNNFGAKYHGEPGELDPLLDEMQPMLDQANEIQHQIKQLDDEHDQMIIQRRDEFNADPSLIENAGQRERVEKDKQAIQQAEERIQHCDKRLDALKKPGLLERAKAAMQHGSVDKAREHYEAEKQAAIKERNNANRSLDEGLNGAARQAVNQSPEGRAVLEKIEQGKNQQNNLLQQFKETQLSKAKELMSDLFNEQIIIGEQQELGSEQDVKSALKSTAAVETNAGTLANAAMRAERNDRLQPTVQEQIQQTSEKQKQADQVEPNSLRANWKTPVKPDSPQKVGGPILGKH